MSFRTAGGYPRISGAAVALGQGVNAGRSETSAIDLEVKAYTRLLESRQQPAVSHLSVARLLEEGF